MSDISCGTGISFSVIFSMREFSSQIDQVFSVRVDSVGNRAAWLFTFRSSSGAYTALFRASPLPGLALFFWGLCDQGVGCILRFVGHLVKPIFVPIGAAERYLKTVRA